MQRHEASPREHVADGDRALKVSASDDGTIASAKSAVGHTIAGNGSAGPLPRARAFRASRMGLGRRGRSMTTCAQGERSTSSNGGDAARVGG
jgi:hypothetical protein